MKVTMTNEEARLSVEALAQAQETGKLGYAIARNLRMLKNAVKEYIEMRDGLLQKYGSPGKAPGQVTLTGEAWGKIISELGDIPKIENEVDVITVEEAIFISGSLRSDQMSKLLWMVKDVKGD